MSDATPSNDVAEPTQSEQFAVRNNPAGAIRIVRSQQAEIERLRAALERIAHACEQRVPRMYLDGMSTAEFARAALAGKRLPVGLPDETAERPRGKPKHENCSTCKCIDR